jgi:HD domain
MNEEQTWVIPTGDLQIGTTLSFDLTDGSGQVLHKAGLPINERLKERLKKKNIHSVTIRGASRFDDGQTESLLLDSFPPQTIAAIQTAVESAKTSLFNFVGSVVRDRDDKVLELAGNVGQFVEQASRDVASTLAVIALAPKRANKQIVELVAERSAKLSLLSIITSIVNSDEPEESLEIGLAAILHDSSLLLHPEWFSLDVQRDSSFLKEYQRHPIESAELVNGTKGVSSNVVSLITQLHEQADGSGYPRGLKLANSLPGARILNIADAYLSLVEPLMGVGNAPSDVLAYLCFHASKGKFCKEMLQRMIQGMSLYPVGSTVVLDNNVKAVVIQGNEGSPLKPIVRLLQHGNLRIDLKDSTRTITGPYTGSGIHKSERIRKSQMHEILWRTDR